tara:strand:- start:565 stop:684 length:120 start_codon:yes stop_codon:yes gene_type:complete
MRNKNTKITAQVWLYYDNASSDRDALALSAAIGKLGFGF